MSEPSRVWASSRPAKAMRSVWPAGSAARHSTVPYRSTRGPARWHRRPAPLLGEHTDEVLRGIGLSDDELAALHDAGVTSRVPDAAKAAG